jgi:hypothetical protein
MSLENLLKVVGWGQSWVDGKQSKSHQTDLSNTKFGRKKVKNALSSVGKMCFCLVSSVGKV